MKDVQSFSAIYRRCLKNLRKFLNELFSHIFSWENEFYDYQKTSFLHERSHIIQLKTFDQLQLYEKHSVKTPLEETNALR